MPLFFKIYLFFNWNIYCTGINIISIAEAHSNFFTADAQKSYLQKGAWTGNVPRPAFWQDALLSELRHTLS